jgi:hypothetical protein
MSSSSGRDAKIGQSAAKLVAGLKMSQWLPRYDRTVLREVVAEMGELYRHLHHNLDMNRMEVGSGTTSEARTTTITFLDTALRRIRQCVLVYLNYRFEKLQELSWTHVGRHDELPAEIKERLDDEEMKYARSYNDALDKYMIELNGGSSGDFFLDLTTDILPPKGPDVEIELLGGLGERPSGTRFYSRRNLVEPLILSGKAKHINGGTRMGHERG